MLTVKQIESAISKLQDNDNIITAKINEAFCSNVAFCFDITKKDFISRGIESLWNEKEENSVLIRRLAAARNHRSM